MAVLAVVLTAALTFGAGWRALSQIDPQLAAGAANAADPAASDPATADPSTTGEGSGLSAAQVESLRAAARSFGRSAWQAGLLASLLAAVVPGLVARQLVRPLLRLEDAATRVAGGERGVRLPLPRSNDELRTVTAASTPWPRGWSARMPGGAA